MSIRFLMHFLVILFCFFFPCNGSKSFYILWLLLISIIFPWMWEFRMLTVSYKSLNPFLIREIYPPGLQSGSVDVLPSQLPETDEESRTSSTLHGARGLSNPPLLFLLSQNRKTQYATSLKKKAQTNKQTNEQKWPKPTKRWEWQLWQIQTAHRWETLGSPLTSIKLPPCSGWQRDAGPRGHPAEGS